MSSDVTPPTDCFYRDPRIEQLPNNTWQIVGSTVPADIRRERHKTREAAERSLRFAEDYHHQMRGG